MSWLTELFARGDAAHGHVAVAQAILVLSLVAALGHFLGSFRLRGVGLGVAGVLFSGLLFGHLGFKLDADVLQFVREFGLILFVYTIGMQVGPGFIASLRRHGLPLNLMAAGVVLLGVLTLVDAIVGLILMQGWPRGGWSWLAALAALAVAGLYNYLVAEYLAEKAGG